MLSKSAHQSVYQLLFLLSVPLVLGRAETTSMDLGMDDQLGPIPVADVWEGSESFDISTGYEQEHESPPFIFEEGITAYDIHSLSNKRYALAQTNMGFGKGTGVHLLDFKTRKSKKLLNNHRIGRIFPSPNAKVVLVVQYSADGMVLRLFDSTTLKLGKSIKTNFDSTAFYASVSDDGRFAVFSGITRVRFGGEKRDKFDKKLVLYDFQTNKLISIELDTEMRNPTTPIVSRDASRVYFSFASGIGVVEVRTKKATTLFREKKLDSDRSMLALSWDESLLAYYNSQQIFFVETHSGALSSRLRHSVLSNHRMGFTMNHLVLWSRHFRHIPEVFSISLDSIRLGKRDTNFSEPRVRDLKLFSIARDRVFYSVDRKTIQELNFDTLTDRAVENYSEWEWSRFLGNEKAMPAIQHFISEGESGWEFIKARLKESIFLNLKNGELEKLLLQLDSDEFADREEASALLELHSTLSLNVLQAVKKLLTDTQSAEVRIRAERILAFVDEVGMVVQPRVIGLRLLTVLENLFYERVLTDLTIIDQIAKHPELGDIGKEAESCKARIRFVMKVHASDHE